MNIVYCKVSFKNELEQILNLQRANLRFTQSEDEEMNQGFVTVQHDFDLLSQMNEMTAHIIAKDEGKVVGYALAMPNYFHDKIPILKPMFDLIDSLKVNQISVRDENYIVMGQICIEKSYRGTGIFEGLYSMFFNEYKSRYAHVITEVAVRNIRSVKAHLKVGFQKIYQYQEIDAEEWVVLRY
ncbi:MAG: GNAT family N-acetyltransferase [Saprospiraceae bacterium]|nr:GNAT family N-acetyltransferase [Saprospiraceae bacterium]